MSNTTTSGVSTEPARPYMTESETAEILGLSPATLRTWRCLGRGPRFAKVGRSVRYRPADVHEWVESQLRG
jgi:excisionase family DNA binding protein